MHFRLINPVVVAPTVAAVGLAFFSYGFPQAGPCAGISIPLILLVLVFTLVNDYSALEQNLALNVYNFLSCLIKLVILVMHFATLTKSHFWYVKKICHDLQRMLD